MKTKDIAWGMLLVVLCVVMASRILPSVQAQGDQSGDPTVVAQAFYDDYLGELLNSGGSGNYHESEYVTQALIQSMDAAIQEGVSADPFLCAQNFPDTVAVFDSRVNGDAAVVVMTTNFSGHFMTVDMVREGGAWKLNDVSCGDRINSVLPVETFFDWYITSLQSGDNPAQSGSFQDRDELSPTIIAGIDQRITEGAFADPFTCGQGVLEQIDLVEVLPWNGETRLLVGTNIPDQYVTITTQLNGTAWQIESIDCGDHLSPQGVTNDFYQWYLDYISTQGNPLSDRAFQNREELAWGLIQTMNRILEEGLPFDPFLCAQDYPESFTTALVSSDDRHASVQVTTNFSDHRFTASLIQTGAVWQIDEVNCPIP